MASTNGAFRAAPHLKVCERDGSGTRRRNISEKSRCCVWQMWGLRSLTLAFCPPEPSYETVSPMLCPPLENCSLSANDCPYGFQQDQNGCLLCQCLSSKSTLLPQRCYHWSCMSSSLQHGARAATEQRCDWSCQRSRDPLPSGSSRRLLPRPGQVLPAAVPHGVREGRLWLRGVRVQRPPAQVPTPDLQQDLPVRIRVSKAEGGQCSRAPLSSALRANTAMLRPAPVCTLVTSDREGEVTGFIITDGFIQDFLKLAVSRRANSSVAALI